MSNPSATWRPVTLLAVAWALSAVTPVSATVRFCLSGNDCADGLFCTVDTCVVGVCVRTDRICADLNVQCTVDRCNESFNRCENIVVTGPCEDFNPVTVNDRCNAQGECKGDNPPLACDTGDDCPGIQICSDGVCIDPVPTATRRPTLPIAFTETPTRTPTRTRTATRTRTPTQTATRTRTSTGGPLPTATASATITPTDVVETEPTLSPIPADQCAGDCDSNAVVAVNELVRGVNIALDTLPIGACPSFDTNGNDRVEIGEIIAAVGAALRGCE